MPLYCMCKITAHGLNPEKDVKDGQHFGAPNRFAPALEGELLPTILLRTRMTVVQNGVPQGICFDAEGQLTPPPPNAWQQDDLVAYKISKHYPNLDLYTCPHCGATVVLEGRYDEKRMDRDE